MYTREELNKHITQLSREVLDGAHITFVLCVSNPDAFGKIEAILPLIMRRRYILTPEYAVSCTCPHLLTSEHSINAKRLHVKVKLSIIGGGRGY